MKKYSININKYVLSIIYTNLDIEEKEFNKTLTREECLFIRSRVKVIDDCVIYFKQIRNPNLQTFKEFYQEVLIHSKNFHYLFLIIDANIMNKRPSPKERLVSQILFNEIPNLHSIHIITTSRFTRSLLKFIFNRRIIVPVNVYENLEDVIINLNKLKEENGC
ncbi:MAG: hypothetical protein OEY49_05160 [Candidatus Heimdallarchaeota archaeon]|nr:hypothetical protein [Candidatus Heimdallarchaeota archaeon]